MRPLKRRWPRACGSASAAAPGIVTSRYATAAAAAAFALIIWGTGLFQNLGTPREVKPAPPAEPKAYSTVTARMNEFVSETGRQINAAITDFFARFQKGAQQ